MHGRHSPTGDEMQLVYCHKNQQQCCHFSYAHALPNIIEHQTIVVIKIVTRVTNFWACNSYRAPIAGQK